MYSLMSMHVAQWSTALPQPQTSKLNLGENKLHFAVLWNFPCIEFQNISLKYDKITHSPLVAIFLQVCAHSKMINGL
jgi:hypothetical protein